VDTSLWDPSSFDISGMIATMAHIGYKVVHDDIRICNSDPGGFGNSPRCPGISGMSTKVQNGSIILKP